MEILFVKCVVAGCMTTGKCNGERASQLLTLITQSAFSLYATENRLCSAKPTSALRRQTKPFNFLLPALTHRENSSEKHALLGSPPFIRRLNADSANEASPRLKANDTTVLNSFGVISLWINRPIASSNRLRYAYRSYWASGSLTFMP